MALAAGAMIGGRAAWTRTRHHRRRAEDQFYGDRTYRAVNLEGHVWTFSVHVRDVTRAEAEAAIGQRIVASSWT